MCLRGFQGGTGCFDRTSELGSGELITGFMRFHDCSSVLMADPMIRRRV